MNFVIAQTGGLSGLDWCIVAAAVVLLFVISYVFGREEKDTNDFFLGGRGVPSIVACLSFVATEVSALTIVGVPAVAFSENWCYLQFAEYGNVVLDSTIGGSANTTRTGRRPPCR